MKISSWKLILILATMATAGCSANRPFSSFWNAQPIAQNLAPVESIVKPAEIDAGKATADSVIALASAQSTDDMSRGEHGMQKEGMQHGQMTPGEMKHGKKQSSTLGQEQQAGKSFQGIPRAPEAPDALAINEDITPQGQPLTIESVEAIAIANNPTLLQARGQIQGELGKAIQAGLWPNPTINYVQEQIGVKGTVGEFIGGTISQRIVTGRKLDLSRAKFLNRTKVAEWAALAQQYRVLNDVRIHYYRTQGHFELVQIHKEMLKNAEDNLLTTRERFNVGQATRAEVHKANVVLQKARLDLMKMENEYHQSFELLSALVGVDMPLAPLSSSLEGPFAPIDYQEAYSRLIEQSPQMQGARCKLKSDQITVRREIVEPIPDIVVEGGVGYNDEANNTVADARISLEVPLYDWNQGTIRQAEADYARQQGEVRRVEKMLKQQLARTYRMYLTALQHAENYEQVILPESRSAYELQLRSYKDNRINWDEVLNSQQYYYMMKAEYIRNLIDWREAEVLIEGFLLHGGLDAPSTMPAGHINAVPKPR